MNFPFFYVRRPLLSHTSQQVSFPKRKQRGENITKSTSIASNQSSFQNAKGTAPRLQTERHMTHAATTRFMHLLKMKFKILAGVDDVHEKIEMNEATEATGINDSTNIPNMKNTIHSIRFAFRCRKSLPTILWIFVFAAVFVIAVGLFGVVIPRLNGAVEEKFGSDNADGFKSAMQRKSEATAAALERQRKAERSLRETEEMELKFFNNSKMYLDFLSENRVELAFPTGTVLRAPAANAVGRNSVTSASSCFLFNGEAGSGDAQGDAANPSVFIPTITMVKSDVPKALLKRLNQDEGTLGGVVRRRPAHIQRELDLMAEQGEAAYLKALPPTTIVTPEEIQRARDNWIETLPFADDLELIRCFDDAAPSAASIDDRKEAQIRNTSTTTATTAPSGRAAFSQPTFFQQTPEDVERYALSIMLYNLLKDPIQKKVTDSSPMILDIGCVVGEVLARHHPKATVLCVHERDGYATKVTTMGGGAMPTASQLRRWDEIEALLAQHQRRRDALSQPRDDAGADDSNDQEGNATHGEDEDDHSMHPPNLLHVFVPLSDQKQEMRGPGDGGDEDIPLDDLSRLGGERLEERALPLFCFCHFFTVALHLGALRPDLHPSTSTRRILSFVESVLPMSGLAYVAVPAKDLDHFDPQNITPSSMTGPPTNLTSSKIVLASMSRASSPPSSHSENTTLKPQSSERGSEMRKEGASPRTETASAHTFGVRSQEKRDFDQSLSPPSPFSSARQSSKVSASASLMKGGVPKYKLPEQTTAALVNFSRVTLNATARIVGMARSSTFTGISQPYPRHLYGKRIAILEYETIEIRNRFCDKQLAVPISVQRAVFLEFANKELFIVLRNMKVQPTTQAEKAAIAHDVEQRNFQISAKKKPPRNPEVKRKSTVAKIEGDTNTVAHDAALKRVFFIKRIHPLQFIPSMNFIPLFYLGLSTSSRLHLYASRLANDGLYFDCGPHNMVVGLGGSVIAIDKFDYLNEILDVGWAKTFMSAMHSVTCLSATRPLWHSPQKQKRMESEQFWSQLRTTRHPSLPNDQYIVYPDGARDNASSHISVYDPILFPHSQSENRFDAKRAEALVDPYEENGNVEVIKAMLLRSVFERKREWITQNAVAPAPIMSSFPPSLLGNIDRFAVLMTPVRARHEVEYDSLIKATRRMLMPDNDGTLKASPSSRALPPLKRIHVCAVACRNCYNPYPYYFTGPLQDPSAERCFLVLGEAVCPSCRFCHSQCVQPVARSDMLLEQRGIVPWGLPFFPIPIAHLIAPASFNLSVPATNRGTDTSSVAPTVGERVEDAILSSPANLVAFRQGFYHVCYDCYCKDSVRMRRTDVPSMPAMVLDYECGRWASKVVPVGAPDFVVDTKASVMRPDDFSYYVARVLGGDRVKTGGNNSAAASATSISNAYGYYSFAHQQHNGHLDRQPLSLETDSCRTELRDVFEFFGKYYHYVPPQPKGK